MSTTASSPSAPHAVRVRKTRLTAAAAIVLPLGLAACGMLGGGGDDPKAPVVIPSESVDPGTSPGSDTASPSALPSPSIVTVAAAPPPTVTRTDVVVRRETRIRTATRTLPPVTRTPPPVTLTETRTETQTLISVLPRETVTKTATKTLTRTKTVTKTVTK